MFEPNEPILEQMDPEVREIVEAFEAQATAAGLPYTTFETQAAGSWTAWEILAQGVAGAGTTEDQTAICDALHSAGADTTFNGQLYVRPGLEQLLADDARAQADPGRRLGDGVPGRPSGQRRCRDPRT